MRWVDPTTNNVRKLVYSTNGRSLPTELPLWVETAEHSEIDSVCPGSLVSWEVQDPENESFLEVGSKQVPPTREVINRRPGTQIPVPIPMFKPKPRLRLTPCTRRRGSDIAKTGNIEQGSSLLYLFLLPGINKVLFTSDQYDARNLTFRPLEQPATEC